MSSHKVLIIYENMGAGHLMMADILATILARESNVTIIKKTMSELVRDPVGYRLTQFGVVGWNTLIRHNLIWLADALINYFIRLVLLPIGEVTATKGIHQALDRIEPDIIICTTDMISKSLGTWARQQQIPFFIAITDLAVFLDLVHPHAIHLCYFDETVNAIQSFPLNLTYWSQDLTSDSSLKDKLKFLLNYFSDFVLGYRQNRIYRNIDRDYPIQNKVHCEVIGLLRESQHFETKESTILRQQLNITSDRPCVLIVSGSLGGNFCIRYLQSLQNLDLDSLTLIVACGRDRKLLETINKIANNTTNSQIIGLDYVHNLHEWMSAADVILARPSAGILLEALLAKTPLLFPSQVASNDRGALTLVKKYQLGECFNSDRELKFKLTRLLDRSSDYQEKIEVFLSNYPNSFATQSDAIRKIIFTSNK